MFFSRYGASSGVLWHALMVVRCQRFFFPGRWSFSKGVVHFMEIGNVEELVAAMRVRFDQRGYNAKCQRTHQMHRVSKMILLSRGESMKLHKHVLFAFKCSS